MGKFIPTFLCVLVVCLLFSFEASPFSAAKNSNQHAQEYRDQGYEAQRAGNLDMALSYYQRAISAYPEFAVAYNDIGVVLEAKGETQEAKKAYLKAIALNQQLLSAYYNLAALYEREGDIPKAAQYWRMRIQYGEWSDMWTWRAADHLEALIESGKLQDAGVSLETDAAFGFGSDLKRDAQYHFHRAKQKIAVGKYVEALKELNQAIVLDPSNYEIGVLVEETERRVLLYK